MPAAAPLDHRRHRGRHRRRRRRRPPPRPRRSRRTARPRRSSAATSSTRSPTRSRPTRTRSSRPRSPRATCPRRGSPARSAAPPASCGCSPTSYAAATTSASASTPPCRTAQPLPRADIRQRQVAARPGRRLRRQQLPARLLHRGWRHRLGAGRRLPGRGQGPPRPPAHRPARRARGDAAVAEARPARRHVLVPAAATADGIELGQELVTRPADQGGRLHRLARRRARARRARPPPGPSRSRCTPRCRRINPVVVLPGALAEGDVDALATAYVGSLTLGAGQFCTNPGLLFLPGRRGRRRVPRRRRRRRAPRRSGQRC